VTNFYYDGTTWHIIDIQETRNMTYDQEDRITGQDIVHKNAKGHVMEIQEIRNIIYDNEDRIFSQDTTMWAMRRDGTKIGILDIREVRNIMYDEEDRLVSQIITSKNEEGKLLFEQVMKDITYDVEDRISGQTIENYSKSGKLVDRQVMTGITYDERDRIVSQEVQNYFCYGNPDGVLRETKKMTMVYNDDGSIKSNTVEIYKDGDLIRKEVTDIHIYNDDGQIKEMTLTTYTQDLVITTHRYDMFYDDYRRLFEYKEDTNTKGGNLNINIHTERTDIRYDDGQVVGYRDEITGDAGNVKTTVIMSNIVYSDFYMIDRFIKEVITEAPGLHNTFTINRLNTEYDISTGELIGYTEESSNNYDNVVSTVIMSDLVSDEYGRLTHYKKIETRRVGDLEITLPIETKTIIYNSLGQMVEFNAENYVPAGYTTQNGLNFNESATTSTHWYGATYDNKGRLIGYTTKSTDTDNETTKTIVSLMEYDNLGLLIRQISDEWRPKHDEDYELKKEKKSYINIGN